MTRANRKSIDELTWDNRFQALGTSYGRPQTPTELPDPFHIASATRRPR
mgnify:CR=1 FL=1